MSSKKYRNKICVYCGETPSSAPDHVFARQFFLEAHRQQLPMVPACTICNNVKARLEHYVLGVLPFGGRHTDAEKHLAERLPSRLAKNAKLHRSLAEAVAAGERLESVNDGAVLVLPFESDKLDRLIDYVVRGLLFHHFESLLPATHGVKVVKATDHGAAMVDQIFQMRTPHRVLVNLGDGTVIYEGAQTVDNPALSAWRFRLFGGAMLVGDPAAPTATTSEVAAFTIRKELLDDVAPA